MKLGVVLFITITFLCFFPVARAETLPTPGSGQSFRDCPECPEMLVIPAGSFKMGSSKSDDEAWDRELPQHEVTFAKPFAVGKFAVTFEEWDACLADGGCAGYKPQDDGRGRGSKPVVNVSWNDAKAYVAWLSKKTNKPYRLLSEAEWEYAARAGSTSKTFPADLFDNQSAEAPAKPNAWGLRNVYGSPTQWIADCWNENYKGAPRNGSAWMTGDCRMHIMRCGLEEEWERPAIRGSGSADTRSREDGFRVARPIAR